MALSSNPHACVLSLRPGHDNFLIIRTFRIIQGDVAPTLPRRRATRVATMAKFHLERLLKIMTNADDTLGE